MRANEKKKEIKVFKSLNFCVEQVEKKKKKKLERADLVQDSLKRYLPLVVSVKWKKLNTCFRIPDSYFTCLQPSKPDVSQEENSLHASSFFSLFSRPCYLEECSPHRFPSLTRRAAVRR